MKPLLFLILLSTRLICTGQTNSTEFDSLFTSALKLNQQKEYKKAAFIISHALNDINAYPSNHHRYISSYTWLLAGNIDSAIYQLRLIVDSRDLKFSDVDDFMNDSDFESIYNDARWQLLKKDAYASLKKKYFPPDAFTKIKTHKINIRIDEGHLNMHRKSGTYRVLSDILESYGFNVFSLTGKLNASSLTHTDVLILSNPLFAPLSAWAGIENTENIPARWARGVAHPAYSNEEAEFLKSWVKKGGCLFLIFDHPPNPAVGSPISKVFGIDWPNSSTYDSLSRDPSQDYSPNFKTILFTKANGQIGSHPILQGVDSVTTYTGSSLIGPSGSIPLLLLSQTASDLYWDYDAKKYNIRPAGGRLQAAAMNLGHGKIVMLGEAAMISPFATSISNRGNWLMTLNILRWLTGDLHNNN